MVKGNLQQCPTCGDGSVCLSGRSGRPYEFNGFIYEIPRFIQIPECSSCGDMFISLGDIDNIEKSLGLFVSPDLNE